MSAFSHALTEQPGEYDLTSYHGIKDYLEENGSLMNTKERLENGYFKRCLDRLRHNWVPCERDVFSQGANTVITFSTMKWQRISTNTTRRSSNRIGSESIAVWFAM